MEEDLPKLSKVRGRSEAPHKPDYFDQSLLLIGGKNPIGEPNLRVDWGWDCKTFRNGNPEALAYPGPFLDRWILRKWLDPSFLGSERQWNLRRYMKTGDGRSIDLLGDYPRKGIYGMIMPLTDSEGGFIPLSSQVLLFIDRMQAEFNSRTWNVYSDAKLYARLQTQMAEEEARLETDAIEGARDFEEHILSHQEEINRNPVFSIPNTLWTPEGEVTLH